MPIFTHLRTFRPLPRERRPQDLLGDGTGWTFQTAEHEGEYPDMMPQAILATDPEGRSCVYAPVRLEGQVADSISFGLDKRKGMPMKFPSACRSGL